VEVVVRPTTSEVAFVRADRGIDTPDDEAKRKVSGKAALALANVFLDGTS